MNEHRKTFIEITLQFTKPIYSNVILFKTRLIAALGCMLPLPGQREIDLLQREQRQQAQEARSGNVPGECSRNELDDKTRSEKVTNEKKSRNCS